MDTCRQQLEIEIQHVQSTAKMLRYLAQAVAGGPTGKRSETHTADALEALQHGAEIAQMRVGSLRHCADIYDRLVEEPVPDPAMQQDPA